MALWAVLLVLVLLHQDSRPGPAQTLGARPFADSSPFNVAIAPGAPVDPGSAAMIARATRSRSVVVNLYSYGVPVYQARTDDPTYEVSCSQEAEWGPCPLSEGRRRIPADATPSSGTDGAMVVLQTDGSIDEYWQARRAGSTWTASYGAINPIDGSGWGGESTGSGASRLAGVVRVAEIQNQVIDHALALQSDNVCVDVFRPPALKTDGTSERPDCLPEGARLQLDPTISVADLPGLTSAERTVARAMQVYGGYVMDRSGSPLSTSFEIALDANPVSPGSVYRTAGLRGDYSRMSHVPWDRMRVLERWDG